MCAKKTASFAASLLLCVAAPRPALLAQAAAVAARAERAPAIDGDDRDPVWRAAAPITAFRVYDPAEDADPAFRTEARVAYDERNLYVLVRAFDPRPDSVVALLSRRDVRTPSDQIKVMVDSYHDRRTGFEFAVNPAGVKRDYLVVNDATEDVTWDAVWDVATRVDSLGWVAEFRIPLSQLRYARLGAREGGGHTFGMMITRDVGRTNERQSWPLLRRSRPGIASQFAEVTGLAGLAAPRRVEATPYALTRSASVRATAAAVAGAQGEGGIDWARTQRQTLGGDLKLGVTPNLTLDATVNPDFGQVEADPAVLNLTAFEQFFDERRPFFVEGTGIFRFGGNSSRLFYSRRIGRDPQLAGLVADPTIDVPRATRIDGAAKLTGRLARGTSVGALAASTARETAGGVAVEPRTRYGVLRVGQDLRQGESGVGAMVTGVGRDLDALAEPRLRRTALAGGVDARHRFARSRLQLSGSLAASLVEGSAAALARTQRSSVHYFQRPDDDVAYDPARTRLAGTALELSADDRAGTWQWSAQYRRISTGFETNDLGFLPRADIQWGTAQLDLVSRRPRYFWRNASAYVATEEDFTIAGLPVSSLLETGASVELRNGDRVSATLWTESFGVFCDRCARGGPALRLSPSTSLLINLQKDPRRRVAPYVAAIYTVADGGRSTLWRVRPYVTVRAGGRLSGELGTRYQRNRDNTQWVTTVGDVTSDTAHHVFAHLDQDLLSFTGRVDFTATPTLSVQLYAEPFVTAGEYVRVRELADPRARRYDDRFRPYLPPGGVEGFNEKQLRSTAVLRWEYRPGSALFVVWTQGRDQGDRDVGRFDAARDYRNLFGARPDNTLLVKASWWLNL